MKLSESIVLHVVQLIPGPFYKSLNGAQDMQWIPSRYGQDMPSNPLICVIITNICDIIIYKRGTVSVSYPMRGYRGRYLPCLQRDTHIFDPPFQPVQKPSKNQKIYHLAVFSAKFRPMGPTKAEQERGRCVFGLYWPLNMAQDRFGWSYKKNLQKT